MTFSSKNASIMCPVAAVIFYSAWKGNKRDPLYRGAPAKFCQRDFSCRKLQTFPGVNHHGFEAAFKVPVLCNHIKECAREPRGEKYFLLSF